MKCLILITILVLSVPSVLLAQGWIEHTITPSWHGNSVTATDLDSDSDIDVIGASEANDDIAWWENDGNENFTLHTIADNLDGATSVYVCDLDGDTDIDVLGAAGYADDITWWENDGSENFTLHTIANNFDGATSVYALDLDGDTDIDVLGTASVASDITWFENDGNENFTERTIKGTFGGASSGYACDLDGDGDMDVLGAAFSGAYIAWFENDGNENFTEYMIKNNFTGARSVYSCDLDGDMDIDVLGAASIANDIIWFENDGNENFTERTIDPSFQGANSVYALDLDGDTDIDVLGACSGADAITWWENDGNENFVKHTIATPFIDAKSVYALDLDGDTDIDVLGAASADDIIWWESDLIFVDVYPVSIDIPSSVPEDSLLSPKATVINNGTDTTSFDVICTINPGAYTSTEVVTNLASGDTIQVTFSPDFTFVSGTYTVVVYTQLTDDSDLSNDTLEKVIHTYDLNVGTISIDISSPLPEGTVLNPKATVKNEGTNSESFDVTCEINPGAYSKTQTVSDLAPSGSIQVTFSTPFTFVSGTYTVVVYTQLTDDSDLSNDTLEKIVQTYDPGVHDFTDKPAVFSFGLENNPTKEKALFNLALPQDGLITLRIYDVSGRLVDDLSGYKSSGYYQIPWMKANAGVYFYTFESLSHKENGKLVVIHQGN